MVLIIQVQASNSVLTRMKKRRLFLTLHALSSFQPSRAIKFVHVMLQSSIHPSLTSNSHSNCVSMNNKLNSSLRVLRVSSVGPVRHIFPAGVQCSLTARLSTLNTGPGSLHSSVEENPRWGQDPKTPGSGPSDQWCDTVSVRVEIVTIKKRFVIVKKW